MESAVVVKIMFMSVGTAAGVAAKQLVDGDAANVQEVDVARAECAVTADRERELAAIGPSNYQRVNAQVAAALSAGATAVDSKCFEVDAFVSRAAHHEPRILQMRSEGRPFPSP